MLTVSMSYICPLCQHTLVLTDRTYLCSAQQHQFDLSKEGYVNLLPVQHKRSKDPGDNKLMMQARSAFLAAGHYQPMRDAVAETLKGLLTQIPSPHVLDLGCGEGYYTSHCQKTINNAAVFGLDISKIMIRFAAKRHADCHFVVASSQRLPFPSAQFDAVMRVFAPCYPQELNRTVKDKGIMVTVTPGPRHLYQLKEKIYDTVHLHDIPPESLPFFDLESEQNIAYPMTLSGEEASMLLQMTPFAWRAPTSLWETLKDTSQFDCEADFTLRVYRKKAQ